jgi:hypothetical protein
MGSTPSWQFTIGPRAVYLSWPEFDRDDLQPLARQVLRFWGAKVCELPPEVVAIGDPVL